MDPIGIPNGIGWSPDSRIMYWTDSMSKIIYKLDYDPSSGAISNRRVFYEHKDPGVPDGLRVDVEGCLWVAVWGGYRMLRLDTEGKLIGEISLPTKCVTCPQFVGTEVIITTAVDEDEEQETEKGRRSRALGGAVFKLDVGVKGVDLFKYKMQ
jgi:sugar lactone lactonase YvrE